MSRSKPQEPVSPAIAAQQAEWHCQQAAEFFGRSISRTSSAAARARNRNQFFSNARLALPAMGVDKFLAAFKPYCQSGEFSAAEPLIRELATEGAAMPAMQPGDANRLQTIGKLIEAAVKLAGGAK